MSATPLSRSRRVRLMMAHSISLPLQRFFSLFPASEVGHAPVDITRLPCRHAPLAGRRAVQISDLHLDRYHARHDGLVDRIAGLRPDWIFVTGDLVTMASGLPHLFRFLAGLRSLAPVYLTLGNHDHYSGVPLGHFSEMADRHKVDLLVNQTVFLPLPQGELAITGVDDPSLHRADLRCLPRRAPGRFTVLLAHAPNILDLLDDRHAADLVLCGHSHGGQWQLPFIRPFWLPYGCNGREAGEHRRNGHRLYINRGLGWSMLPIRLNCPPEIVVIDWE